MQKRSSLFGEFGWLALFFAVFVVMVYALNIFVVPHHFNDKIAILIAALIAGLVMIVARSRWRR